MEDDTPRGSESTEPQTQMSKRPPRRSEVQSQVNQMTILSRILNQPVTLAVGEVFGIVKIRLGGNESPLRRQTGLPDFRVGSSCM